MNKWWHIVNNEIKEIPLEHPLDHNRDKTIFMECLMKDLKLDSFKTLSDKTNNLFMCEFNNNFYNISIEQVDQGGKTDTTKKVCINFQWKAVKEILTKGEKLLVINIYCPLIKIGDNYELDWKKRVYMVVRPDEIYSSKVYHNLMESSSSFKKISPSSRWVDLKNIHDVMNKRNLQTVIVNNQEIKMYRSKKTKHKSLDNSNIYIVDKENIYNLLKYVISKEYSKSIQEIIFAYSKNLVENKKNVFSKYRNQFRELLFSERGLKCEIINCKNKLRNIIVASHIKPVNVIKKDKKLSTEEKIIQISDTNNGFLLCSNHDKLFDRFIISFDIEGNLIMDSKVEEYILSVPIVKKEKMIEIKNKNEVYKYLKYHNKQNEKLNIFID